MNRSRLLGKAWGGGESKMPRLNRMDLEEALSDYEETQGAIGEILADDELSDSDKTEAIADLLSEEAEDDYEGD